MMSSEEEKEDENNCRIFAVKTLPFRSKKFEKLIKKADELYSKNSSQRSKEQMVKRVVGSPSKRMPPKSLEYGYEEFINLG